MQSHFYLSADDIKSYIEHEPLAGGLVGWLVGWWLHTGRNIVATLNVKWHYLISVFRINRTALIDVLGQGYAVQPRM